MFKRKGFTLIELLVVIAIIAILAAILLWAAPLPVVAMTLTENSEARCAIVVPDDAWRLQTYAAEELQYFLQQISGAEIQRMTESDLAELPADDRPNHLISVGPTSLAAKAGIQVGELPPEAIRILTVGDDLIIVGGDVIGPGGRDDPFSYNNQTGTLFAVYDFLQDQLGVRWLWPGEVGTVIPKRSTIVVGKLDIYEVPQLKQRRLRSAFNWSRQSFREKIENYTGPLNDEVWQKCARDENVWLKRMRMGRSLFLNYGHAFTRWWELYGEDYPKFFALTEEGKREPLGAPDRIKMCVAEPRFWDFLIKHWMELYKQHPIEYQTLNVCENDGPRGFCTCKKCTAWDVPGRMVNIATGTGMRLCLSDRYAKFWKAVAERLAKVAPDAYVVAYAYDDYRLPPVDTKMPPNIIVGLVPEVDYPNTGMNPPPPESSAKFREDWKGWADTGVKLFLRPNWLGDVPTCPKPCTRQMADDFRFAVAHEMIGTDYDSLSGQWGTNGPTYYLLARLHWDVNASTDQLLNEFYGGFGPAGSKVREYFEYWENYALETWSRFHERILELGDNNIGRGSARVLPEIYTEEAFNEGMQILVEARRVVADAPEQVQARVEHLIKALRHARMTCAAIAATEAINTGQGEMLEHLDTIRRMQHYREQIADENIVNIYWAMWQNTKYGDYAGYMLTREIDNPD